MHNRCPWTSFGNIQHFLFNLFWSSPEIYFWSPPAFLPLALICCYYVSFSWEYIPSLLVVLSFLYINFIMKNITSEGSWRWKILLRILIIWKVSGWEGGTVQLSFQNGFGPMKIELSDLWDTLQTAVTTASYA